MRYRLAAKSAASSPPVPARTSTMTSRSSRGSFGTSARLRFVSCSARRAVSVSAPSRPGAHLLLQLAVHRPLAAGNDRGAAHLLVEFGRADAADDGVCVSRLAH